jgi:uncharacterized protein YhhL (DUF1145 family)
MTKPNDSGIGPSRRHPDPPPNWYGPTLGAVWALLLIQVMLPFPWNVAIATVSAAIAGYLVGRVEGDLGGRRKGNVSRHGAPLVVFLLGLLGLSLFAYHVADIAWSPPALGLVAFGAAWVVSAQRRA